MPASLTAVVDINRRAVRLALATDTTEPLVVTWSYEPPGRALYVRQQQTVRGSTQVIDHTPPLDVPVRYAARLEREDGTFVTTVTAGPVTVSSDHLVWVRTLLRPAANVAVDLTEAPALTHGVELDVWWPASGHDAVATTLPRHKPVLAAEVLTLTAEQAARLRTVLADNPVMVQWPTSYGLGLPDQFWAIGEIIEKPGGPAGDPTRTWTLTLTPVAAANDWWARAAVTYDLVQSARVWAAHGDADRSGLSHDAAEDYAADRTAPAPPPL